MSFSSQNRGRKSKDAGEFASYQKRTAWTQEEDEILKAQVARYGTHCWPEVASGLQGRTSKACSLRWRCFLSPNIIRPNDEPFSQWEVAIIVLTQRVFGNKWNDIASYLPMRCNNDIKNYFNLYLKDKATQVYSDNAFLRAGYELSSLLQAEPPEVTDRRKRLEREKGPAAVEVAKVPARPAPPIVRKPSTPTAGKPRKPAGASNLGSGLKGGVAKLASSGSRGGPVGRVASAAALTAAMSEDYAAYYSSDGSFVMSAEYCGSPAAGHAYTAAYAAASPAAAGAATAPAGGVPAGDAFAASFTGDAMADAAAAAAAAAAAGHAWSYMAGLPQQLQQQDAAAAAATAGYAGSSTMPFPPEVLAHGEHGFGAACYVATAPEPASGAAADKASAGVLACMGAELGDSAAAAATHPVALQMCPGSIGERMHFLPDGTAASEGAAAAAAAAAAATTTGDDAIAAAKHTFWKPLSDGISPLDASSLLLEDDPVHDDVIAEFAAYEDEEQQQQAAAAAASMSGGAPPAATAGSPGSPAHHALEERPESTTSASSGAVLAAAMAAVAVAPATNDSRQSEASAADGIDGSSGGVCDMQQDGPVSAAAVAAVLASPELPQHAQQEPCTPAAPVASSSPGLAACVPGSPVVAEHAPPAANSPATPPTFKAAGLRLGLLNPALHHVMGGGDRNALSAPCTVTAAYTPNGSRAAPSLPAGAFTQGAPQPQHDGCWSMQQQSEAVAQQQAQQMHTPFTSLHHQQQHLQEMCLQQQYSPSSWGVQHHAHHQHHQALQLQALQLHHHHHQQQQHQHHQQQVPSPTSATATVTLASGGFNSPTCTPSAWAATSRQQQAQSALRPSAAAAMGAERSARTSSWGRASHHAADDLPASLVASSGGAEKRASDAQCCWPAAAATASKAGVNAMMLDEQHQHHHQHDTHASCAGAKPLLPPALVRLSDDDGVLGRVWDSFDGSAFTHPGDLAADEAVAAASLVDHIKLPGAGAGAWGSSSSLDRLADGCQW